MVIGWKYYNRVQIGWSWTKTLFVFEMIIVVYMVIFEFGPNRTNGFYVMLVMTSYFMFWTFCIVIDSCRTEADKNRKDCANLMNKIFRWTMHAATLVLLVSVIWMPDCTESIYPWNYLACMIIVFFHQMYDLFLFRRHYLVNLNDMPPTSIDRLHFNPDLFKQQTKVLFISNLVFGLCSTFTVIVGIMMINPNTN